MFFNKIPLNLPFPKGEVLGNNFYKLLLLFSFLSLILNGCGKGGNGMPPPVVEAATAKFQPWQTEVNAIGTLAANQGVVIKPEVGGRVTAVFFHSGDAAAANTPLIQINADIIKAQLASARAKSVLSKASYERAQALFKRRVSSAQDLDTASSNYQADLAAVAQYQAMLDQTLVRTPFAGRLGLRMVNLGDYVTAGQSTITNVQNLNPIRVDFSVPEVYLKQLAVGQKVSIHSNDYPKDIFQGTVYAFDTTIDPNTRSLAIRASVPNANQKLLPGAFVEIRVFTGKPEPLVTIPETALSYGADGEYVYKVEKDLAIKTKVTVGQHKHNQVAILKGLKAGDVVVSAGQFKITGDKSPVMISK